MVFLAVIVGGIVSGVIRLAATALQLILYALKLVVMPFRAVGWMFTRKRSYGEETG